MSEYQYFEFRVVEQPLNRDEMSQLRALSTRAVITPTSFTNTYHWGDFRGNPRRMMEGYFDAHIYISNWGTVTFMLRLPRGVLPKDTLAHYATGDGLDAWATEEHTLLEWGQEEEPRDEDMEGEGWMAQLLPLRDELVRGDYRSLYIGWLSSFAGELREREDWEEATRRSGKARREPPVPPGLGTLTDAQAALAEFLGVNNDLIVAAAKASSDVPVEAAPDTDVDAWVARLPETEMRAVVARIIHGEGGAVQTELQSRYYRSRRESPQNTPSGDRTDRRTADALVAVATSTARARERREQEEKERKRHAYLADLAIRFPALWATANALAEEKKASSYDKASATLADMRDAYTLAGRRPDFDVEFTRFQERHSHRAALVRRLKEI